MAQGVRAAHHEALEGRRQRAQDATHAHLGAQQTQLAGARVGQLEVVDAHDAHATRVDDLFVEQVTGDEDLVGLQVGEADVGGGNGEADLVVIEGLDVLAPRDHERRLAGALEGQRGDAGKDLARGNAEVVDDANLLAVDVENGVAQKLGQVDHTCSFVLAPRIGGTHARRGRGGRHGSGSDTPCGASERGTSHGVIDSQVGVSSMTLLLG